LIYFISVAIIFLYILADSKLIAVISFESVIALSVFNISDAAAISESLTASSSNLVAAASSSIN